VYAGLGTVVAVIVAIVLLVVLSGDVGDDSATDATTTTTSTTSTTEPETTTTTEAPATTTTTQPEMDRATVAETLIGRTAFILLEDGNGFGCSFGSGSVVDESGLILTNAHVAFDLDGTCPGARITVGFAPEPDVPPEIIYYAEPVAADGGLDIAVIRIIGGIDGSPLDDTFDVVTLGDSDDLSIGSPLFILGYPGIGGETITVTQGLVSGFTTTPETERAWIKTDASISGGNSGGLAIDAEGRLVGIPTQAGQVDCRRIEDTDGNGILDGNDSCVPIGGFLNQLRPVNLAKPLIADAIAGTGTIVDVQGYGDFFVDGVIFEDLVFSRDLDADGFPLDVVRSVPTDVDSLCLSWLFSGMADGVPWDLEVFVDGGFDPFLSSTALTWDGGESGAFSTCVGGMAGVRGVVDFRLLVEGEFVVGEAIVIGESSLVELTLLNDLDIAVCYVNISPTVSTVWGGDELGPEEVILPGGERSFSVPFTDIDVQVLDCGFGALGFGQYFGADRDRVTMSVQEGGIFVVDSSSGDDPALFQLTLAELPPDAVFDADSAVDGILDFGDAFVDCGPDTAVDYDVEGVQFNVPSLGVVLYSQVARAPGIDSAVATLDLLERLPLVCGSFEDEDLGTVDVVGIPLLSSAEPGDVGLRFGFAGGGISFWVAREADVIRLLAIATEGDPSVAFDLIDAELAEFHGF
jgi:S1-C subfamily serine protease